MSGLVKEVGEFEHNRLTVNNPAERRSINQDEREMTSKCKFIVTL